MVSIITSVYNCEDYVEDMINSILNQSYDDWELIIIDDASSDNTWEIISSFVDHRIVKLKNEKNEGLTVNLNKAWDLAKGEYLARIDGDDIAYYGRLSKQVEYMERHPDTVILGGGMTFIGEKHSIFEPYNSAEMNRVGLLFDVVMGHPTMMMRKKALEQNGIKYNSNLRFAQDYDLEYRASQIGEITAIPECVIKYRVHDKQVTREKAALQKQCADFTRRKALYDLGIQLKDYEFDVWSQLCTWDSGLDEKSLGIIEDIISSITEKNRVKKLYDERLLSKAITQRVNHVKAGMNMGNSISVNKYEYMFQTEYRWVMNIQNGKKIARWMYEHNIESVAVYGVGFLGKCIVNELLTENSLKIRYIMDNRVIGDYQGIEIINDYDKATPVDAVIVTVLPYNRALCKQLGTMKIGSIYMLDDLIHETSLLL